MAQKKEKSFLNDFLTLGVGTFIYLVVGVIGTPIITRLVDPVDYGRMSMLTVYSGIGALVCGMGLDQTMVRFFYQEDDENYKRKLVRFCCRMSMCGTLILGVLLAAFWLLSQRLGYEMLSVSETVLLEVNIIAQLLHRYSILVLRMRRKTKLQSTANILQKASYIAFSVVLIMTVSGDHFLILAVSTIAGTLLSTVIAILGERNTWHSPERGYKLAVPGRELIRYGLPVMMSSGISMIFHSLDRMFVNHYCTMADVGVYASAMNLMAVFTVIQTSFNSIWMPSAVAHYEKNPADKKFYQQGHSFIAILMFVFGAGVVLCKDLFVLFLGPEYREASKILPFLMFEPIMYTISETTATGIVVQKKPVYQLAVSAIACAANFFGNWLLVPVLGPQGAAISTGVAYVVFFAMRTFFANRVYKVDYKLSRFTVSTAALMLFSIYASNHSISLIYVLLFAAVAAVVLVAYRKDVAFAVGYGKQLVLKILKRK